MQLNQDKTKEMMIGFSENAYDLPPLTINGKPPERVKSTTLLGVNLIDNLSWENVPKDHRGSTSSVSYAKLEYAHRSSCKSIPL